MEYLGFENYFTIKELEVLEVCFQDLDFKMELELSGKLLILIEDTIIQSFGVFEVDLKKFGTDLSSFAEKNYELET